MVGGRFDLAAQRHTWLPKRCSRGESPPPASYLCFLYIVAKPVERVIADQLRIARRVEHGASEPEDRSHVQRSDGNVASEPETANFTAVQRAYGDVVCTLKQLPSILSS